MKGRYTMKNAVVKKVLCLSLSATLILGESATALAAGNTTDAPETAVQEQSSEVQVETEPTQEVEVPEETEEAGAAQEVEVPEETEALSEKIVSFTSLDTVSGIGYEKDSDRIIWNKVPNATQYKVTIKDASTGTEVEQTTTSNCYYSWSDPGNYTVEVVAIDEDDVYTIVENLPAATFYENEDNYKYDEQVWTKGTYGEAYVSLYAYPKSATAGVAAFAIAETPQEPYKTTKSTIGAMSYIETTQSSMTFRVGIPKLMSGESVEWEYSNNEAFVNDQQNGLFAYSVNNTEENLELGYAEAEVPVDDFSMGERCYVRARIYSDDYEPAGMDDMTWSQLKAARYGAYARANHKLPKAAVKAVTTVVTNKSVTLTAQLNNGSVTGYEFAKKENGKWKTLEKQTEDTYQDSGLTSKTTYQYRVRGYQYNKQTKKTTYTSWKTVKATTWGKSLNLKSNAENSKKVKLSWNKVSGAEGYEIYRLETASSEKTITSGAAVENFASYTHVKTLKKGSAKSWTDKGVTSGNAYGYIVRAYKTTGKTKSYIEDYTYVDLTADNAASGFYFSDSYYNNKGQYKVTWKKIAGLKGYRVEKKDAKTGAWTYYKKLKSKATSVTLPSVPAGSKDVTYRIRPYTSEKVYSGVTTSVKARLATVSNVKATATTEGIKVTWKPVAGADYYRVYRTTSPKYTYNKDAKTYNYSGNYETVYDAAINTIGAEPERNKRGYNYVGTFRDSQIKGTSVVDKTITYTATEYDDNGAPIEVGKDEKGDTVYKTKTAVWNDGPQKGVKYYYYVVAYAKAPNGSEQSDSCMSAGDSKAASAMFTSVKANKVKKITSAKSSKKGQVTIKYKKAKSVSGYAIYRATSKNGSYKLIAKTSKTSYTDKNLKSKKKYYYKVGTYKANEAQAYVYSGMTGAKKVKVK